MNKEKRFIKLNDENLCTRALQDEEGNKIIEGYASVFNHRSKLIFENGKIFNEVISRSAFDDVLQNENLDVLLTFQHDTNRPMARLNPSKGINSLQLSVDEKGLKYRAVLPNTSLANDTYELIRSGVLFENSFIFTVKREDETWAKDEQGNNIRTINKVSGLYDVSVVVEGAYSNTDLMIAERLNSIVMP